MVVFQVAGVLLPNATQLCNTTILKGSGNVVVYNESIDPTSLLDGFTITGGASQSGGGMYNFKASPIINNCVFTNNAAAANGGTGRRHIQQGCLSCHQ